ncbi:MAG: nuclease-related domain-containing protein [Acutalibacteraceae bacterium]|nr:nuclease-related domain-containing protein [Acutalibacteraceae bacterium]
MGLFKVLKGEEPNFVEKLAFKVEHLGDKGAYGEYITGYSLDKINEYHKVFKNVYLPHNGKTTEIDIVLITSKGIFVIENKNYAGWVFGDEKYKYWHHTYRNGEKYKFFNPIWQNQTHINALSNFLKVDKNTMKSYIVFSGENFKGNIKYTSDNVKIITHENILKNIKKDLSNSREIFTDRQIDIMAMNLNNHCNVSNSVKKEHVKNIKNKWL